MAIQSTLVTSQSGGQVNILIVPAGKSWAVTTMLFCNIKSPLTIYQPGSTIYLDLHIRKSGIAFGPGNQVLNSIPIPAGETFSFDTEKIILEENDIITIAVTDLGSAPDPEDPAVPFVTATVSYIEV